MLAACLCAALPADPLVERIEAEARRVHQLVASPEQATEYGPFFCTELTVNTRDHPWPVVGVYRHHFFFYYDRDDGGEGGEPHPYPDRLRLVRRESRVSDRDNPCEVLYDLKGWPILVRVEGQKVFFRDGKPLTPGKPGQRALKLAQQLRRIFLDSLTVSE